MLTASVQFKRHRGRPGKLQTAEEGKAHNTKAPLPGKGPDGVVVHSSQSMYNDKKFMSGAVLAMRRESFHSLNQEDDSDSDDGHVPNAPALTEAEEKEQIRAYINDPNGRMYIGKSFARRRVVNHNNFSMRQKMKLTAAGFTLPDISGKEGQVIKVVPPCIKKKSSETMACSPRRQMQARGSLPASMDMGNNMGYGKDFPLLHKTYEKKLWQAFKSDEQTGDQTEKLTLTAEEEKKELVLFLKNKEEIESNLMYLRPPSPGRGGRPQSPGRQYLPSGLLANRPNSPGRRPRSPGRPNSPGRPESPGRPGSPVGARPMSPLYSSVNNAGGYDILWLDDSTASTQRSLAVTYIEDEYDDIPDDEPIDKDLQTILDVKAQARAKRVRTAGGIAVKRKEKCKEKESLHRQREYKAKLVTSAAQAIELRHSLSAQGKHGRKSTTTNLGMRMHFRRPQTAASRLDISKLKDAIKVKKKEVPALQLDIKLVSGKDLLAMDISRMGRRSSDPFVTFRHARQVQKSSIKKNTLQPVWNEIFHFMYSSREEMLKEGPVLIELEDYDFGTSNDPMGNTIVDISELKLDEPREFVLPVLAPENLVEEKVEKKKEKKRKSRFGSLLGGKRLRVEKEQEDKMLASGLAGEIKIYCLLKFHREDDNGHMVSLETWKPLSEELAEAPEEEAAKKGKGKGKAKEKKRESAKERLERESAARFRLLTEARGVSKGKLPGAGNFLDTNRGRGGRRLDHGVPPVLKTARLLAARGMARGGIRYEDIKTECIRQHGIDDFYKHKKAIVISLQREGVKVKVVKKRVIVKPKGQTLRAKKRGTGYVVSAGWAGPGSTPKADDGGGYDNHNYDSGYNEMGQGFQSMRFE